MKKARKGAGRGPRKSTPIRKGLKPDSPLQADVKNALGAVKSVDKDLVSVGTRKDFGDSLDLDGSLRATHPQAPRWDYLLGHTPSGTLVGVEPHPATNAEIEVVIQKRVAARTQLRGQLKPEVNVARWLWVASGKSDFLPHEKKVLYLAENGIAFVGRQVNAKDVS